MRDVILQPIGCNLVGALTFLADTLAFLDTKSAPFFDCHPSEIFILDNGPGAMKIIDWADGFDNRWQHCTVASCLACRPGEQGFFGKQLRS